VYGRQHEVVVIENRLSNCGERTSFSHVVSFDKTFPSGGIDVTYTTFGVKYVVPELDVYNLGEALNVFGIEKINSVVSLISSLFGAGGGCCVVGDVPLLDVAY
jgi:hypothetical protein